MRSGEKGISFEFLDLNQGQRRIMNLHPENGKERSVQFIISGNNYALLVSLLTK